MRRYLIWSGALAVVLAGVTGCGHVSVSSSHGGSSSPASSPSSSASTESTTPSTAPSTSPVSPQATSSPPTSSVSSSTAPDTPASQAATSPSSTASGGSGPLTAASLPSAYPHYSLVLSTVGRLLAQSATVPVFLPNLGRHPYSGSVGDIDVQYTLKNGYRLTLSGGAPLPANSPKISFGNAEFLYSVRGLPWSSTYVSQYMPLEPKPMTSQHGQVTLATGIIGTSYPNPPSSAAALQGPLLIVWHEDGWALSMDGTVSSGIVVGGAKQMAQLLNGVALPGSHGQANFTVGSDDPSIASYDLNGTRYVIEALSWKAATLAAKMEQINP